MADGGPHYDAQAECLVVEVQDEHLRPPQPCVRLVHWLVDNSGEYLDYAVRLYPAELRDLIADLTAALERTELPTEGGADDDTTDQGRPGGETAAETRAGADSREVGAVVSEAPPVSEEGGVGEPSAGAPPNHLGLRVRRPGMFAEYDDHPRARRVVQGRGSLTLTDDVAVAVAVYADGSWWSVSAIREDSAS